MIANVDQQVELLGCLCHQGDIAHRPELVPTGFRLQTAGR